MNEPRLICTLLFDTDTNEIIVYAPDDTEMRWKISDNEAAYLDAERIWYALYHDM